MVMRISTKGRYGTRLMLELALKYHENKPVLLRQIAENQKISLKYLEQIISPLKNAGFVRAIRGAKGGYMLSKPPEKINLAEIIQCLEGEIDIAECITHPEICDNFTDCITREIWKRVSIKIRDTLESITLADLCKKN
jgi:Rrf2 family protein